MSLNHICICVPCEFNKNFHGLNITAFDPFRHFHSVIRAATVDMRPYRLFAWFFFSRGALRRISGTTRDHVRTRRAENVWRPDGKNENVSMSSGRPRYRNFRYFRGLFVCRRTAIFSFVGNNIITRNAAAAVMVLDLMNRMIKVVLNCRHYPCARRSSVCRYLCE